MPCLHIDPLPAILDANRLEVWPIMMSISAGAMPLDSRLHDSIMHVASHCFNLAPNFGFLFGQLGTLGLSISLHRELQPPSSVFIKNDNAWSRL